MKYQISFKHIVEEYYVAYVEADSEKEAEKIFDKNPFEFVEDQEPNDTQGLEIVINEIEEVE